MKSLVKDLKSELPENNRNVITYSKNFSLILSTYCSNKCSYCYFHNAIPKQQEEDNVLLLTNAKMIPILKEAKKMNCIEALLMSGENPDCFSEVKNELMNRNFQRFTDYVKDLCKKLLVKNFLPHTNIGTLKFEGLKQLKEYNASMGLMLESTSENLCKGGGVHQHSPGKIPERRLKHIEDAGKLKIPFTTGLLLGIGETLEDRIKDLMKIKEINEQYGHIQEIIIQNFIPHKGIPYVPEADVTIKETLRTAALAKIVCGNQISIQVPPNLISNHIDLAIEAGVDDFGGISPLTKDYINPEYPWPRINFLKKICKRKGVNLKERYPIYDKFIGKNGFCPESIKKVINNIKLNE